MTEVNGTVFIVDDDGATRDGLAMLLRSYGHPVETFSAGQPFLRRCQDSLPDRCMAILDLSMPGMDGLELQAELSRRCIRLPMVFLSGEGDIPAAVQAVRRGAIDFVEKPVDTNLLIDRVRVALKQQQKQQENDMAAREILERLDTLTSREREVLDSLAAGKISKIIAYDLNISERTVELHRSRVLKKMGARNTAELLNQAIPVLRRSNNTEE